jgi:hypothetical protein
MFYRVVAAATCALFLAGCQQAGPLLNSTTAVTAPSSLTVKPVDVPFTGVLTGEIAFDLANPKACAAGFTTTSNASGTASHMGLTTWYSQHCSAANHQVLDGTLVLTAANGDEIRATYSGSCAELPNPGEPFTCSGNAAFSQGTGRFANAGGTAEWSAIVVFEADFTWPIQWEWEGSVRY